MRRDEDRLRDILDAIDKTRTYYDPHQFVKSEVLQAAMLHYLQIIGEACNRLSDDFKADHPDVPWAQIIGFRNIIVHQYFGIDLAVVEAILTEDLPILKQKIEAML